MAGQVYFGTKSDMQWIPAPAVNMGAGKSGFSGQANFLNGGSWVRRSKGAAKTYNMSWNLQPREAIQPVLDYADGLYGDGYLYFLDPFGADRNALPAAWATPYINAYDGPVIVDDVRPTLQDTGSSVLGFPRESAVYTLTSTSKAPSVYVPIPDTYVGYLTVFGEQLTGNASINIKLHVTTEGGSTTTLPFKPKSDIANANNLAIIPGSQYRGVTVSMTSTSTGTMRLDGMMLQVLPAGAVRSVGRFVSGQGTSGLSFVNQPAVSAYSAVLDRVGVSAELVETEAWNGR